MTTQQPHRIELGQEYETCQPIYWLEAPDGSRGPVRTRIRIKGNPTPTGRWGVPNVAVVTIADDGRELRPRTIPTRHLHPTATGPGGKQRKTGYYLVRNADGSAA